MLLQAVYQQKLFGLLWSRLAENVFPGALPPAALIAICGLAVHVPQPVIADKQSKVHRYDGATSVLQMNPACISQLLTIGLIALAAEDEGAKIAAVGTIQVLFQPAAPVVSLYLQHSVPFSSFCVNQMLTKQSVELLTPHLSSVIPKLLELAKKA